MIKYGDLVEYIKENHVNWNTDLFDVLRGFFDQYSLHVPPPSSPTLPAQQELLVFEHGEFKAPEDGEYTNEDLMNLFST